MRLIKLSLKNFKGIKSFEFIPNGYNASIFGENATGKTTLYDAFLWLLFDKDSQNKKDFEIKTLDAGGQPLHGLDHEVEVTLETNERILVLRKTYKERWTKKRGSAKAEFTGHTVDYFVNGVPFKKANYDECIDGLCDEKTFKLLTSPTYFNENLPWQSRRQILLEVCGDISDNDVIASNPALSKLPQILGDYALDDYRKIIQARRSEINKEIEKLPIRIDEVNRGLPDISDIVVDEVIAKISILKSRLIEKNQEVSRIQAGGQVAEATKVLREIESQLLDLNNKHRTESEGIVQDKKEQIFKVQEKSSKWHFEISKHRYLAEENNEKIKEIEGYMAQLRSEWQEANKQQFEFSLDAVCPTCGQALPEEMLEEARGRALAAFNLDKAKKLECISADGKKSKARVEEFKLNTEKLKTEIAGLQLNVEAAEKELAELQKQVNIPAQDDPVYTQELGWLLQKKGVMEKKIAGLSIGNAGQIEAVKAEIKLLEKEIDELKNTRDQVEQNKRGQVRIEELKQQERTLAAEYEKLESELYLCETFIKAKVSLLEAKINSRFKYARFQLFENLINGGITEVCNTLYNGVPYSSGLNHGAQVTVGLDIISTLADHYNFHPVIFVDNAEAITDLPEIQQMIKLYVSEKDKALRIEIINGQEAAIA